MSNSRCFLLMVLLLLAGSKAEAKVLYVDPVAIQASDEGAGTELQPLKTLSEATTRLEPGDELIIAGGVYRESLILPNKTWSKDKSTLVRAKDERIPIINGSDVLTGLRQSDGGLLVKDDWQVNTQQVFLDGKSLQQIGGTVFDGFPEDLNHPAQKLHQDQGGIWLGRKAGDASNMPYGSFFYDNVGKKLFIRMPAGEATTNRLLEASVRPYLLLGHNVSGLIVRGLSFTHSNTSDKYRHGAVSLIDSDDNQLEGLKIIDVDGVGLHLKGDRNIVRSCRVEYAGRIGIAAKGRENLFENNITNFCNTRGFNPNWEAGGCKFMGDGGLQDSKIIGHTAMYNFGDGIWFDTKNNNNEVTDSVCAYNAGHGIHYEVSTNGLLVGNYCYGNAKRGIYVPFSSGNRIFNNLMTFNGLEGFASVFAGRKDSQGVDLLANNNMVFGNVLAWNNRQYSNFTRAELILPENGTGNRSNANLFVTEDGKPGFSVGFPGILMTVIKGLDDWRSTIGQDIDSWQVQAPPPVKLMEQINNRQGITGWDILADLVRARTLPANRPEGAQEQVGPYGIRTMKPPEELSVL